MTTVPREPAAVEKPAPESPLRGTVHEALERPGRAAESSAESSSSNACTSRGRQSAKATSGDHLVVEAAAC